MGVDAHGGIDAQWGVAYGGIFLSQRGSVFTISTESCSKGLGVQRSCGVNGLRGLEEGTHLAKVLGQGSSKDRCREGGGEGGSWLRVLLTAAPHPHQGPWLAGL